MKTYIVVLKNGQRISVDAPERWEARYRAFMNRENRIESLDDIDYVL